MKEIEKYIPLDKSWIIRMGILDMLNGYDDILSFLEKQTDLGGDIAALKRVVEKWDTDEPLDVGEGGTLYRFIKFILWKQGKHREIIKRGTLKNREICDNPEIVNWPLNKLLTLDGGTSQWANISVLLGNVDKLDNAPLHLKLTQDALKHWNEQRVREQSWIPMPDGRIKKQAEAFVMFLRIGSMDFKPDNPEDYCFSRAFNIVTKEEGEKRWPHIIHHESNRLEEMEEQLDNYHQGSPIDSKDHRVIQAIVMKALAEDKGITVVHKDVVNKTWPKFWDYIEYCKTLKK